MLGSSGRAGFIVPTGIATDDTTKAFFSDLMSRKNLAAFYGFENEAKLFKGIDHRVNFCLLVLSIPEVHAPSFSAFIREPSDLETPGRVYQLTTDEIATLNPNSGTCPVFRTQRDAEINKTIYRRVPVLIRDGTPDQNPWSIRFLTLFHMANDSDLFRTRGELDASGHQSAGNCFVNGSVRYVPLYEAKMIYNFNHRLGDFALLDDGQREHILPQVSDDNLAVADYLTMPRYWVPEEEVAARLAAVWSREWLLGWRDVTDAQSSVRTVIVSLLPRVGVGHTISLALPGVQKGDLVAALYANLTAFVFDYIAQQKIGGTHLTYGLLRQLPVFAPKVYQQPVSWNFTTGLSDWLVPRVLELTYTAWDMQPFAPDCGYDGPPFRWDEGRRFLLRCELDAAYFHLYGLNRDEAAYILETFPVVRKRDEAKYGEYRTAQVILEVFDRMAEATLSGISYKSLLDPPPGPPAERLPEWRSGEQTPAEWPVHIHPPRHVHVGRLAAISHVGPRQSDPVEHSTVAPLQRLQIERITSYIVLLLREWKKPAGRNVLEAALVLMLNDGVRARILARPASAVPEGPYIHMPEYVRGLDGLLDELQKTGLIGVETANSRQTIRLGPAAPNTANAPEQDITTAHETLEALAIVGEDRISDVLPQFVTQSYELVS